MQGIPPVLDRVQADVREDRLMQSLSEVPLEQLPAAFERIAPEEIALLATAPVRLQSSNIEQRLQEVRIGAHGLSAAGFRTMDLLQGVPQEPGSGVAGRTVASQSREILQLEPTSWTFFVSGNLQLMDVGATPR